MSPGAKLRTVTACLALLATSCVQESDGDAAAGQVAGDDDGNGGRSEPGPAGGAGGEESGTAGGGGDGGSDEVVQPPGSIPMFVALGQGVRTLVSCDDGETWVGEQAVSSDPSDHGPYAAKGLAYGDGTFIAGVGWGAPGRLRRSENGIDWTEPYPPPSGGVTQGIADVAFGNGKFVAIAGDTALVSSDGGLSWQEGDVGSGEHVRTVGFGDYQGGRFVLTGDAGRIQWSADGLVWHWASNVGTCPGGGNRYGGIRYGNGVFLISHEQGLICRSTDGGDTWTAFASTASTVGNLLFNQGEFYGLDGNQAHRSADGIAWSTAAFNFPNQEIRQAAISTATGTYAGIAKDGVGYFRSEDGTGWTMLAGSGAPPGAELIRIAAGYGKPSAVCPAP